MTDKDQRKRATVKMRINADEHGPMKKCPYRTNKTSR